MLMMTRVDPVKTMTIDVNLMMMTIGVDPMTTMTVDVDADSITRARVVHRTYGTYKNQCISLFLRTIFGAICYGPP